MKIIFRKYQDKDFASYNLFCKKNFHASNYQSKKTHLRWLSQNNTSFFNLALNTSDQIVGCIHGYEVIMNTNLGNKSCRVLHDLSVNKEYKGAGLKLLKDQIFIDKPVILAHVTGKVSKSYEKIGSIKISSDWMYKFLIPRNIFCKNICINIIIGCFRPYKTII